MLFSHLFLNPNRSDIDEKRKKKTQSYESVLIDETFSTVKKKGGGFGGGAAYILWPLYVKIRRKI